MRSTVGKSCGLCLLICVSFYATAQQWKAPTTMKKLRMVLVVVVSEKTTPHPPSDLRQLWNRIPAGARGSHRVRPSFRAHDV